MAPQPADAELVTLVMMQAMPGFTSEAKWLRYARSHLRHLFPCLPKQPGYNKCLRKAAELLRRATRLLATDTSVWSDDVWIVDSTPVECGHSRETVKRSDPAGWAEYGYCASHSRFFCGLCLHLVCTLQGLPIAFALTGAEADERETLLDLLAAEPGLTAARPGQTPLATGTWVQVYRRRCPQRRDVMTGVSAMTDMAWVPQSCTLPTEERPLRVAEWDALFAERLTALAHPQALRLRLDLVGGPGVVDRIRDLAEREGGCCSFFAFTVTPGEDLVHLEITVDQAHEAVLAAIAARTGTAGEAR
nr:transposase [Streptomyces brasiliensis]